MVRIKESLRTPLICLLLAAATLAAYWPVLHNDFINYDDPQYVTLNPHVTSGVTSENVKWAFSSGYASNWHPLTWISHMLDVQVFGLKAGGHHLTNLLLHVANTLLLFVLLRRMTSRPKPRIDANPMIGSKHESNRRKQREQRGENLKVQTPGSKKGEKILTAEYAERAGKGQNHEETESCGPTKYTGGTIWQCAFVAALFALHPLHVESVAWVSERKDVLSGFFFMLTLLAYAKYAESKVQSPTPAVRSTPEVGKSKVAEEGRKARMWYVAALAVFALGLMSKPMLVTLPFVLLLLDYWPLHRFSFPSLQNSKTPLLRLVREKLPFFVLSIASCVVTLPVQKEGGAVISIELVPFGDRLANATMGYLAYLRDTSWPVKLAVFYPMPVHLSLAGTAVAVALLLVITIACLMLASRVPHAFVGWFWYLGMLIPVIGLVQVGEQARADRYTYLPLIGIFILVSWGLARLAGQGTPAKVLARGAATFLLAGLLVRTHQQVRLWKDSQTLFEYAAKVTTENYLAWECVGVTDLAREDYSAALTKFYRALGYARAHGVENGYKYFVGVALQLQDRGLEALPYLEKAIVGPERRAELAYRLGLSLMAAGRLSEAEVALKQALEIKPKEAEFQVGMAVLLQSQGQTAKAEQLFRNAIGDHPDITQFRKSFADFLLLNNRLAEAEAQYATAVKLKPQNMRLRKGYSTVLARAGKTGDAIRQLAEVLKAAPADSQANFDLAELLSQQGKNLEAVTHYNRALDSDPKHARALNNLAWLLATDPDDHIRNGARAVELAERACQLTEWKQGFLIGTLAAAYAEAGRFSDAVATAEKARDKARADKLEEVAKRNEELLQLYKAGKPYHEK